MSLKNDHDDYFCSSTRHSFPISIEKISYVRTYEFKEKFQRIFVVIENCHRLVVCNGGDLKPDSSFRGSEPLTSKVKSLTYYLSKRVGFILLKIKSLLHSFHGIFFN